VSSIKQKLKEFLFAILGKEPEAAVVSFLSGDAERARAMLDEVRTLVPNRKHYAVAPAGSEISGTIPFTSHAQLRRELRRVRIGLAPVLFDGDPAFHAMRRAALLLAPRRILAYNRALERHHLRLRTLIASWLFWRGVPLDRIFLRPSLLFPWKRDRSVVPDAYRVVEGRPLSLHRRAVGVLTPYFPYPLSHGGAVRIFNLLRQASAEFDIFLFSFSRNERDEELQPVLDFCAKAILVSAPRYREPRWASLRPSEVCEYRAPAMARAIDHFRRKASLSLLQVEYTQLATYGGDVLVEHDITFDLFRQIQARHRTIAAWWDLFRWKAFESRVVRNFQRVVVMSDKDAKLLRAQNAEVIPNGVDLDRFRPTAEIPGENLLFIGSFRHFPNVLALQFFLRDVWPAVRGQFPGAVLDVIGGPDAQLYWRQHTQEAELPAGEGIRILGFVSDVRPLYEKANIVIVPTTVSAGTNLKVLEAMAMERAVVSTTSGCAGLGLHHGQNVWVADTAEAFAEGIAKLLREPGLRSRLAAEARARAVRHFDWKRLGELQAALWRDLLNKTSVRQAKIADLPDLERIQNHTTEASQWETERYLEYDCCVAVQGGTVAGFVVSRQTGTGEREVLNLAVAREFRRRGVGSALLRDQFHRWGGSFFLEVRESNGTAQNLYRKLGFIEVGRRKEYYDNPTETAIVMKYDS
jgi:ribosomal-protein-alanine acetyltransferase